MKDKTKTNEPAVWKTWTFPRVIRDYWVDLILLNMIFLLFCLPVFSVPAALMSMFSLIFRMQKDEPIRVIRDFCRETAKMQKWALAIVYKIHGDPFAFSIEHL